MSTYSGMIADYERQYDTLQKKVRAIKKELSVAQRHGDTEGIAGLMQAVMHYESVSEDLLDSIITMKNMRGSKDRGKAEVLLQDKRKQQAAGL